MTVSSDVVMLRLKYILAQLAGGKYAFLALNLRITGAFQIGPPARGDKSSSRSQQTSSIEFSEGTTSL
jgi:hypothetical protein